jgi:hypothetical protein
MHSQEVAQTTNVPSPRGSNPPTPVQAVQPSAAMLSPPPRPASAQTTDLGPMGFSPQTHDAQAGNRSTSMPNSAQATGILTQAQKRYQTQQQFLIYQQYQPERGQAQPLFAERHRNQQQEQPQEQRQQQQQQLDKQQHLQLQPQPQQRQHLSSAPLSLARQPTRSSPARKLSRTTTGGFRAANVQYEENV